jgi:hypothetical protein
MSSSVVLADGQPAEQEENNYGIPHRLSRRTGTALATPR